LERRRDEGRGGKGREEKGEEERKRKGFWEAEGQSMHPAAMGDTRL